jgi:hypothetical protein
MTKSSNSPPTIYAVVRLKDRRFAVEITKPNEPTVVVKPFWTESEANDWIAAEKLRAERDST